MPFDGVDFQISQTTHPGAFSQWGVYASRYWIQKHLHLHRRKSKAAASPAERRAAAVRLLEEAKALIEDRRYWLQGSYRWFGGRRCAIGALRAVAGRAADISVVWEAHALLTRIAHSRRYVSVESMNDRSSHWDVLRAFDEAIALAARGV